MVGSRKKPLRSSRPSGSTEGHPTKHRRDPAPVTLQFNVPVQVEDAAASLLATLPESAVRTFVGELRSWIDATPAVREVSVCAVADPETDDWNEVLFEVRVDIEFGLLLNLWDDFGRRLDGALGRLDSEARAAAARYLAVDLQPIPETA